MSASPYGTRPEYLPEGVRRSLRVKNPEVFVLSAEENEAMEKKSLARFAPSGSLDLSWDGVLGARMVVCEDATHGATLVGEILLNTDTSERDIAIFCKDLSTPSLRMTLTFARNCLVELFDEFPGFWVYDFKHEVLIECRTDGEIFYGPVPREQDHEN